MLRPLARFVREVGYGVHAGNAIRHGQPLDPPTRQATGLAEPPPAPARRDRRRLGG
ncbi:hypothetical protein [Streptomyces sp. 8K308]|uniref:hypothetical protein n=1 Tax=Streptomyces sp. 8K308 TaxID=2530388 RepID=UPI0014053FD0|nr:hypothetical protein [Streptomyces sp. 8K308]